MVAQLSPQRLRDAKRHRASQRLFNGGKRPFGFDVVGEAKISSSFQTRLSRRNAR